MKAGSSRKTNPILGRRHGAWNVRRAASETYRATFGGALASRELWVGRSGSDRYLSLLCGLVTRVSGRIPSGAFCPKWSLAREASTLSLATCLPGFPGVVLIPLGRLPTSPIPLLRGGKKGHH